MWFVLQNNRLDHDEIHLPENCPFMCSPCVEQYMTASFAGVVAKHMKSSSAGNVHNVNITLRSFSIFVGAAVKKLFFPETDNKLS